jgi:hypothetical protein
LPLVTRGAVFIAAAQEAILKQSRSPFAKLGNAAMESFLIQTSTPKQ